MLSGQSSQVSSADVADAVTLAGSRGVLDQAAALLHDGQTGKDLASRVAVVPSATSNELTITATEHDARSAKQTSAAVAAAMIAALRDRITASSEGLTGVASDFRTQIQQRADVLNTSVRPLVALATGDPQQTAPTTKSLIAFAIVGLAAGTLLVVGVRFGRPTVEEARVAQRLVGRPAVPFRRHAGSPDAYRLVRRLLDERGRGSILLVPVDEKAEKSAAAVADWARTRSSDWNHTRSADEQEAGRIVSVSEPAVTVLAPRPGADQVAAVLLVVPKGTTRRAVDDAVTLLNTWRPADAVVVAT